MAKKPRIKASKKTFPKEELTRAAAIAAGLEASFADPAPPGAMAPAPLLDEIREMGEVGLAGVLNHLSSTTPEGRIPILLALRELGDPSIVQKLVSLVRTMRLVDTRTYRTLGDSPGVGCRSGVADGFR